MDFRKIVSVTGIGGLFELVGAKKDGAIIRSLTDKTTRFVAQRIHNISNLENIEVYTTHDNVNLTDVFIAMQNSAKALPSDKDAAAIKAYFEEVYPSMDFERVYASDMKKMVKWFGILKENNIEVKPLAAEAEETETPAEPVQEEQPAPAAEEKPAKKPRAKAAKPAAKSEEKDA